MNVTHQIVTLFYLKAKLTFRSYARNTLAVIQSILFCFFIVFFSLMLGFGVVVVFFSMRHFISAGSTVPIMVLSNLLWGIYGLWILVPVFGFRMNESYDISKLLHLPVRRSTLFVAGLIGGFADLTILIPIAALTGVMFIFAVDSTLGTMNLFSFIFNAVTLFVFLINMLIGGHLVVILIYNVFPRISFWKILLGFSAVAYITYRAWFGLQNEIKTVISIFDIEVGMRFYSWWPHGMATKAVFLSSSGHWPGAINGLIWLIIHTIILGVITGLLFVKWHATGDFEGMGSSRSGKRWTSFAEYISSFWTFVLKRVLPVQALEIMKKDHLFLLRNKQFVLTKGIPALIGPGIIMFAIWYSSTNYPYIKSDNNLLGCLSFSAMVFSTFIITAQANVFAGNQFGLEGRGIISLFTTPVDKKQVLLGKNVFLLTLYVFDALVYGLLTWLLLGSPVYGGLAFVFLFSLFVMLLATGNFSSILLPYYFDLERPAVSPQQVLLIALVDGVAAITAITLLTPIVFLMGVPFFFHMPILNVITIPFGIGYCFTWLWVSIRLAAPLVDKMERNIMLRVSER